MSFVIYNTNDLHLYRGNDYYPKSYEKESVANGQLTKLTTGLKPKLKSGEWKVVSYDVYKTFDTKVTVKNMMSGKDVLIDVNDVGGCCDPSTEHYWTM